MNYRVNANIWYGLQSSATVGLYFRLAADLA